MAAPTTIRRELLNARVYFIPAGETVDSVTVSATAWPDGVPTTNWTAYQLHDTETIRAEREYEQETFQIPRATGGYIDDDENTLRKVMFTGVSAKTSSLMKQLEHGLPSQPVVGTPLAPFSRNDDFIEGVSLLEFQNKSGTVTERLQVWSRIRLSDAGEVGPQTKKLTYVIEVRDSALNTYLLVA